MTAIFRVKAEVTTTTPSTAPTTKANPLRMIPTRMAVPLQEPAINYNFIVTADLKSAVSACLKVAGGVVRFLSRARGRTPFHNRALLCESRLLRERLREEEGRKKYRDEGRADYAPANMSDVLRNLIEVGLAVREDNRPVSAPIETIMERLAARSPGNYGHVADERRKVADLISTIEPLLRESADQEIDTRRPTTITVDEILRIV